MSDKNISNPFGEPLSKSEREDIDKRISAIFEKYVPTPFGEEPSKLSLADMAKKISVILDVEPVKLPVQTICRIGFLSDYDGDEMNYGEDTTHECQEKQHTSSPKNNEPDA